MKKKIHPYLEPKLIIHTNGSTYLTGIPLLLLCSIPQFTSLNSDLKNTLLSEPKLLCFGLHYKAHGGFLLKPQHTLYSFKDSFFSSVKMKIQQYLFTSYLIKYLDFSSKNIISSTDNYSSNAVLHLIQPINKKLCLVLDIDVISNSLWNGNVNFYSLTESKIEDSALFKFKKRYGLDSSFL